MKENVFSREESDGSVTVYSPQFGVEANGFDLRAACDAFVAVMKAKYPWNRVTVQPAGDEALADGLVQ